MFQLNFWLREVIFFLPLDDLDELQRILNVFLNGRPCYFIKRLVHSFYKEISGANVYLQNLKKIIDKLPFHMKKFFSEYVYDFV